MIKVQFFDKKIFFFFSSRRTALDFRTPIKSSDKLFPRATKLSHSALFWLLAFGFHAVFVVLQQKASACSLWCLSLMLPKGLLVSIYSLQPDY